MNTTDDAGIRLRVNRKLRLVEIGGHPVCVVDEVLEAPPTFVGDKHHVRGWATVDSESTADGGSVPGLARYLRREDLGSGGADARTSGVKIWDLAVQTPGPPPSSLAATPVAPGQLRRLPSGATVQVIAIEGRTVYVVEEGMGTWPLVDTQSTFVSTAVLSEVERWPLVEPAPRALSDAELDAMIAFSFLLAGGEHEAAARLRAELVRRGVLHERKAVA
jgi:hypothetical protein